MEFQRKDYSSMTLEELNEEREFLLDEKGRYEEIAYNTKKLVDDAKADAYEGKLLQRDLFNRLQDAAFKANKDVKYIDRSLSAIRKVITEFRGHDFFQRFFEIAKAKLPKETFKDIYIEADEELPVSKPITQHQTQSTEQD